MVRASPSRRDADYVFYELTRSICPTCKRAIDAQVLLRQGKVMMRKRCPQHGWFEALLSSDAEMYLASLRYNKPGSMPLQYSTDVVDGCPYDCGLCPQHQQHTCLALVEVNSHCNLDCPICFADAGPGFSLSMEQVGRMLDRFVELEGDAEVVQFSGGEPTIHPHILEMVALAKEKGIRQVMINTNGIRIARDDAFLEGLQEHRPVTYLQFDGFEERTNRVIRGRHLLGEKLRALDRLAEADLDAILVPAIERGVNDHEIGAIVRFGVQHPAVRGIAFQPVTHSGRYIPFDPMSRVTIPDVLKAVDAQTGGMFRVDDFVPVPCCHPACRVATYAYVEDGEVTPLPRVLDVEDYLNYITNRSLPDPNLDIRRALEDLWSASAVPGSDKAAADLSCAACDTTWPTAVADLKQNAFMIVVQAFADAYTMDLKQLMKCCVGVLVPDGRMVPFCAYNTVGYREQVKAQLAREQVQRGRAR